MEILQKEGKAKYSISGRQAVYKSNPGTAIVCRKRGPSGQEKYNTSNIYTVNRKRGNPVLNFGSRKVV